MLLRGFWSGTLRSFRRPGSVLLSPIRGGTVASFARFLFLFPILGSVSLSGPWPWFWWWTVAFSFLFLFLTAPTTSIQLRIIWVTFLFLPRSFVKSFTEKFLSEVFDLFRDTPAWFNPLAPTLQVILVLHDFYFNLPEIRQGQNGKKTINYNSIITWEFVGVPLQL